MLTRSPVSKLICRYGVILCLTFGWSMRHSMCQIAEDALTVGVSFSPAFWKAIGFFANRFSESAASKKDRLPSLAVHVLHSTVCIRHCQCHCDQHHRAKKNRADSFHDFFLKYWASALVPRPQRIDRRLQGRRPRSVPAKCG